MTAPSVRQEDERVEPPDRNLAWVQFRNPMDLRIVDRTCGTCHASEVESLLASLHGTTAGHLSDGYYEMGLLPEKGSRYSVFPQASSPRGGGEVERLVQVPAFQERAGQERQGREELARHYTDLARKECLQCHLWSQGRAVRGRVGFDGDYRGAGCAACHVEYALDGLSRSADAAALRTEPGHPRQHRMTRAPPTATCSACHYGDASIGLHFRGLSQLPPNAPGGPDIPGTTSQLLNRVFYLDDRSIVPPDVHHERGMHCIDCHTLGDVMGDGALHGWMENAVEISCSACHGTFTEPSFLTTERGTPLEHLRREGETVILTSKVDGVEHVVPQVVHVLDPERPEYNADAARAMTDVHGEVECYTCHAGWNVNFLGFHFSRQESLSQLDLLSGKRTSGRVTTQEKVFATWKSFYAGRNERGAVAPYLTGFSTMGSVWDERGELVLDQVLPVTAAGLSGMSMIHHQPHSTRPTARSCVECHRSPATWGLGSGNFRLARQLAFVAERRGIEVVAINRTDLTRSAVLAKLPLAGVVDLCVDADPLQGHAQHLYAAERGRGVHVIDVSDPTAPRKAAFRASVDARRLELAGEHLYLADGSGGLRIYDVSRPEAPRPLGKLATFDARDVDVHWPWAYVADGFGGLLVVDVRDPREPRALATLDVNGDSTEENQSIAVESLFQYSRPMARDDAPVDKRTPARNLCAVLDRRSGLFLVDVTEPGLPVPLFHLPPREDGREEYRDLALLSQVDLAEAQGGERTRERDYAYVLSAGLRAQRRSFTNLIDVSDPARAPRRERTRVQGGNAGEQLVIADYYSPPFRRRIAFTASESGVYLADLSTSREPSQIGLLPGIRQSQAVAVEEFPLDRMITEDGRPLKDVSHANSRWFERPELDRVLSVPPEELGTDLVYRDAVVMHGATARAHLEALDLDRSGLLEGQEYERGGGRDMDPDGDGRISLQELARVSGVLGTPATSEELPADEPDLPEDGELALLLDGTDPFLHDQARDGSLARDEIESAFFDALDLDDDEKLTPDELSRSPGELRELRFDDERARELFRGLDKNHDGRVSAREYRLEETRWQALDLDGDGALRLVSGASEVQSRRGYVAPGSEWPVRRTRLVLLPPGIAPERLLEVFDRDGDGELVPRELGKRPDLLPVLDADSDGRVTRAEIDRVANGITIGGVDVLADDFTGRWDLDGSGTVEAHELPEGARLRLFPPLADR